MLTRLDALLMMSKSLEIIPRLKKSSKGENQAASTNETAFGKEEEEEEGIRCQRHCQDEDSDERTAGLKPLYHRPRGGLTLLPLAASGFAMWWTVGVATSKHLLIGM